MSQDEKVIFDTDKVTAEVREIVSKAVHEELEKVRETTIPRMVDDAIRSRIEPVTNALSNITNLFSEVMVGYTEAKTKDNEQDSQLAGIQATLEYFKKRDENMENAVKAFSSISHAVELSVWFVKTWWGKAILLAMVPLLPKLLPGIIVVWGQISDVVFEFVNQFLGV